ncbi:MAG: leucine-rich repeat domain-containing protein [Saprospiraceae bacterium]
MRTPAIIIVFVLLGSFLFLTNQYEVNQMTAYLRTGGCERFYHPLPKNFTTLNKEIKPLFLANKEELHIFGKNLTDLPHGYFDDIDCFKKLKLSNNYLNHIPLTIQSLASLKELNLSNNQIEGIPFNFFEDMVNLTKVDLSFNNLKKIPIAQFNDLKHYNLSNNSIADIREQSNIVLSQKETIRIQSINLMSNGLKYIPNILANVQNLKTLTLSDNYINTINSFDEETIFNDLNSLVLTNNHIVMLPEYSGAFPQLEHLHLNNNKLISDVRLMGYYRLKEANFNNQLIKSITLGGTYNLETLNAKANRLNDFTILKTFPKLTKINLQENEFLITPDFSNAINLEELNLSMNHLNYMNWEGISHIKKVNLSYNSLTEIPEINNHNNHKVKELNLFNNNIKVLNLDDLPLSLEELNLNSNELTTLKARKKHSNLLHLKLAYNNLTNISISFLKKMPNLKSLQINDIYSKNEKLAQQLRDYCYQKNIKLILE